MAGLIGLIRDSLGHIASGGLNLLFPPRCVNCHGDMGESKDHQRLCAECCRRLVPERWICCRHCGAAVVEEQEPADDCPLCKNQPLKFDTVVAIGAYDNLREVVLRMKHSHHEPLTMAMGRLLAEKRFDELAELRAEIVIPVPMHWFRRFRRGTNNPDLVAHCLGQKLNIPVERGLLVRCRNTPPQSGPAKERFRNVRGAFRVRRPERLKDARVLLVDDVLTTGATGSEVARILKKAGAAMVAVAVVARAQGAGSRS